MTLEELDKSTNEEVAVFLIKTYPDTFSHCPEEKRIKWLANHSEARNFARVTVIEQAKLGPGEKLPKNI